jgi:hypothetical protein
MNRTIDVNGPGGHGKTDNLINTERVNRSRMKRTAISMPRMRGSSFQPRKLKGGNDMHSKSNFGIIPTLTPDFKEKHRLE